MKKLIGNILYWCEIIAALAFGIHTLLFYCWYFNHSGVLWWLITFTVAICFNRLNKWFNKKYNLPPYDK